jgi:phosphoglycerate dehydrogenase-like enzyme
MELEKSTRSIGRKVCFAHSAYHMQDKFEERRTGIASFQVRSIDELKEHLSEVDVVVISMMWKNELLKHAPNLKYIQSISSGTDHFDRGALRERGIRLASASGANANAVAEHAMALMLSLRRHVHTGRDNQSAKLWRGMISDLDSREDELAGKTLLVVGYGRIGSRLGKLAKAFNMNVIAVKQDVTIGAESADEVYGKSRLFELLPRADVVALTCPLTGETENLITAAALKAMKTSAHLINVARGKVVDEAALIDALESRSLRAAGLDVTREEPLPPESPLWRMPNVLITPHTAAETCAYEDNVIDILIENLSRLGRGELSLRNQVV